MFNSKSIHFILYNKVYVFHGMIFTQFIVFSQIISTACYYTTFLLCFHQYNCLFVYELQKKLVVIRILEIDATPTLFHILKKLRDRNHEYRYGLFMVDKINHFSTTNNIRFERNFFRP